MCGGGKLFSPKVSMRDMKSFSSPVIPKRRSVFRAVTKASIPWSSSIKIRDERYVFSVSLA